MNEKIVIIYIDEDIDEISQFQLEMDEDFEVIAIEPVKEMKELIKLILQENANAIISDYNLKEKKSTIGYMGDDVIERIIEIKKDFPCFILSNHYDDASDSLYDVSHVYPKSILWNEDKNEINLKKIIKKQVKHYLAEIEKKKERLNELKQKKELNSKEEDELIEIGYFLESISNKEIAIPKELTRPSYIENLNKLISDGENLINEISKKMENKNE